MVAIPALAAAVLAAAAAWDVRLAPSGEPGTAFVVNGHVRKSAGSPPLAGARVYAYHADAKGLYTRPGHETEGPRLAGTATTNDKGEYRIRTVMPGTYGGPAHVHFEVWSRGLARRAFVMNLDKVAVAKDPQAWLRGALNRRRGGSALVKSRGGVIYGAYEIVWDQGLPVPGAK